MKDIVIDGKIYEFIDRCTIDNKNYVVFEDDDSVYVCEYVVNENGEVSFLVIDDALEDKVLETLGLNYE
jgi:hypothetical protein